MAPMAKHSNSECGGDAQASSEAAAGAWQLVWCSERCHKPDQDERRKKLLETTEAADGSLVCSKKANKFGTWLRTTQATPYVLLVDWRECKPCLEQIVAAEGSTPPLRIVVLAEDAKIAERAKGFVNKSPADAPEIVVVGDIDAVIEEVCAAARCPSSRPGTSKGPGSESRSTSPGAAGRRSPSSQLDVDPAYSSSSPSSWSGDAPDDVEQQLEFERYQRHVDTFLQSLVGPRTPEELEELLLANRPQFYEE